MFSRTTGHYVLFAHRLAQSATQMTTIPNKNLNVDDHAHV